MTTPLLPMFGEVSPLLIPIAAIVMSLAIPIVAIIADSRKKRAIYELHHRERLAAIDKGMEVPPLPPELFDGRSRACGPANGLLRGLIWSAIGIGMLVALREVLDDAALLGVIPLLIGVAYLIYYFVEGRKLVAAPKKVETAPPSQV
jgi:hypothetical protein